MLYISFANVCGSNKINTMPIPSFLINQMRLASWPQILRKPFTLGLIRRKALQSLPFKTRYHGLIFEGDAANMIDYHVLSRGCFEPGLSHLLIDWAKAHPQGIFMDVGANVGIHTLAALAHYPRIIAVEPYPPLAKRLRDTLAVNKINNVCLLEAALAETEGTTAFKIPSSSNLGTGSIVAVNDTCANEESISVRVLTGDGVISAETLPLVAIKIDTEGAELRVLAGLAKTLQRDRPLVMTELLEDKPKASSQLVEMFPTAYTFFRLEGIKNKRYRLSPWASGHGDIVGIPQEKAHLLKTRIDA
jgi:FkbM family methyltransferase